MISDQKCLQVHRIWREGLYRHYSHLPDSRLDPHADRKTRRINTSSFRLEIAATRRTEPGSALRRRTNRSEGYGRRNQEARSRRRSTLQRLCSNRSWEIARREREWIGIVSRETDRSVERRETGSRLAIRRRIDVLGGVEFAGFSPFGSEIDEWIAVRD